MKLKYPVPIKIGKDMTIWSNSDNVTCLDFGYLELTEKTIDLAAFNKYQVEQEARVAHNIDDFWDIEAENIGGKTSARWLREMERQAGASKKGLSAFPKFTETRHCAAFRGPINAGELHIGIHYGVHYTAVITQYTKGENFSRWDLVHCYKGFNQTIKEFIGNVKKEINEIYPMTGKVNWHITPKSVYANPDDLYKATGSYTPLKIFREEGIKPIYFNFEERDALDPINCRLMTQNPGEIEYITVNPYSSLLKRCLNGGYSRGINNSRGTSVPTEDFVDDKMHSYTAWCLMAIGYYLYQVPDIQGIKVNNKGCPGIPM